MPSSDLTLTQNLLLPVFICAVFKEVVSRKLFILFTCNVSLNASNPCKPQCFQMSDRSFVCLTEIELHLLPLRLSHTLHKWQQ